MLNDVHGMMNAEIATKDAIRDRRAYLAVSKLIYQEWPR